MDDDKKKIVIGLIIILFIILMEVTIVSTKFSKENFKPIGTEIVTEEESLKENDSYDWVYDATFSYNITSKSYTTNNGTEYSINDIKLPYININSKDASKINKEISSLFDNSLSLFNKGLSDNSTFTTNTYVYSLNDNVLSILITNKSGKEDTEIVKYYTYNLNIDDGNILTNQEINEYLGYDSIDKKIENSIKKYITEQLKGYKYIDSKDLDYYIEESIKNYQKEGINYYLDSDKKLNAIVRIIMPTVSNDFYTILTID